MRFIKTFESFFDLEYNIGDHVKFYKNYVLKYKLTKIVDINRVSQSYKCELFFNDKLEKEWLDARYIERLLTPDEIEKFEIKKASIKYNI